MFINNVPKQKKNLQITQLKNGQRGTYVQDLPIQEFGFSSWARARSHLPQNQKTKHKTEAVL